MGVVEMIEQRSAMVALKYFNCFEFALWIAASISSTDILHVGRQGCKRKVVSIVLQGH